jgi:hypothetical protein
MERVEAARRNEPIAHLSAADFLIRQVNVLNVAENTWDFAPKVLSNPPRRG